MGTKTRNIFNPILLLFFLLALGHKSWLTVLLCLIGWLTIIFNPIIYYYYSFCSSHSTLFICLFSFSHLHLVNFKGQNA